MDSTPRNRLIIGITIVVSIVAAALLTNRSLVLLDLGGYVVGLANKTVRLRWGYLVPFVAGLVCVAIDPRVFTKMRASKWWWVPIAVIGADTVVALITGFVTHSWLIGVSAALPSLAALGALYTGATLVTWDRRLVDSAIGATALICVAAGVEQMLRRNNYGVPYLSVWLAQFDAYAMRITRGLQFDRMRAEGLDVNPNNFAFLGVVSLIWALFLMKKGALRNATLMASLVVVVLSQARTAFLVVIAIGIIALIDLLRQRTSIREIVRIVGMVVVVAAIIGVAALAIVGQKSAGVYLKRLSQGASIANGGLSSDLSLRMRVRTWKRALPLIAHRPTGYFSTAGLRIGGSLDNESLWRLITGGWLYFLAYVSLLAWLVFALRPPPSPLFGTAFAVTLALLGATLVPTQILGFVVLGWFSIGAAMLFTTSQNVEGAEQARG